LGSVGSDHYDRSTWQCLVFFYRSLSVFADNDETRIANLPP
jgi:hypothetical protein